MATGDSSTAGENGNGSIKPGYHPIPYPFTGLTNGVPLLDTPALATPLVNTLVHLSQNTQPAPRDVPHVLNAYSAGTPSRIEKGVWAYFYPAVMGLPTEQEVLSERAKTSSEEEIVGNRKKGRKSRVPDWEPDELVFPAAIARDLQLGWAPLAAHPDRGADGGHARYRLLVFVHRHRAGVLRRGQQPDAETVYTMSAWDREVGELTHYDFRTEGRGARLAAARLWWSKVGTRFEEEEEGEEEYGETQSSSSSGRPRNRGPAAAIPNWMDMFVREPPVFSALDALQTHSARPIDPPTTLYGVLGGCLALVNAIDGAPGARLRIADDADTATGLGAALLPALYERVFLLLRAQERVTLRGHVAGAAHLGNQYGGKMFHSVQWLNQHLAVARRGSLFRERLRDRLMEHVPLTLDRGTVLILTRRKLAGLAEADGNGRL
ncbi:hypothetical protein F5X99DRAFT_431371 [Biscogniauxia marginata]|nr:hypothetical protein F5X99DRAFT_431371 [Biscogniauxia marginata]